MLYKNAKLNLISKFNDYNVNNYNKLKELELTFTNNNMINNVKLIYPMYEQIINITGQIPLINKAKKNNSGFNIRKKIPISLIVTLRKKNMIKFLKKYLYIVINKKENINKDRYNNQKRKLSYQIGYNGTNY
jgi:large subunit ribosomal protein L5